jgi:tryptophan 2,3-dioxygenase
MQTPARWKDDPVCGHLVAHEHQTHYCTYIRVPRLLSLQSSKSTKPDEIHALLFLQAFELWFRVAIEDMGSLLNHVRKPQSATYLSKKLLNRLSKILSVLDNMNEIALSILVNDLALQIPFSAGQENDHSEQFAQLKSLDEFDGTQLKLTASKLVDQFHHWSEHFEEMISNLFEKTQNGPDYGDLLQIGDLLSLQDGVKADWTAVGDTPQAIRPTEHLSTDELMFIVVHQAFELGFRAVLFELEAVLESLLSGGEDLSDAIRRMQRINAIEKLLVQMIHIPSTMLPMDFLQFREQRKKVGEKILARGLSPASGTESYQFREIEILSGLNHSVSYEEFLLGNQRMHIRFLTPEQEARLERPSLHDAFNQLLEHRGIKDVVTIFQTADTVNPHLDLAELADLLLEFDQFFQQWRMNHLTMVQSMIGRKSGTGFLGPEYLKETLGMGMQGKDDRLLRTPQIRPRFFEDLWEARTRLGSSELLQEE